MGSVASPRAGQRGVWQRAQFSSNSTCPAVVPAGAAAVAAALRPAARLRASSSVICSRHSHATRSSISCMLSGPPPASPHAGMTPRP
ncbi:MAG TPA: hypothetical protein DEP69_02140 [Acidimicrobiaceae bacterium]|nr:hypothetical protein [Acidimicrobiaceae bacterium]